MLDVYQVAFDNWLVDRGAISVWREHTLTVEYTNQYLYIHIHKGGVNWSGRPYALAIHVLALIRLPCFRCSLSHCCRWFQNSNEVRMIRISIIK